MYMTPTELATVLLEAFKTLLSECESYVQYFEQRFRLEEEHVRAVKVMLERQRDLDMRINRKLAALPGLLPDPGRLSNLRNTWGDMRLSEIWAIDVRLNTLMDCKRLVLQPVVQFRDAQERIRRRVKDDLKNCVDDYEEMLHTTLPRIRRMYEKRCEEHEFFRHQQRAIEEQRQLLSVSSFTSPSEMRVPDTFSEVRGSTDAALPPLPVTESNISTPNSSTNRSFLETLRKKEGWDHAPRRLNALFSRMLDVSDRVPSGELSPTFPMPAPAGAGTPDPAPGSSDTLLPPGMSNKALQTLAVKQAKAKREMEESDKAYRKAIFDLETLRLRRNKALEAAVKSLLEWRRELTVTMQNAALQYVQSSKAMRTSIESVHQQDEQLALRMLQDLDEEQRICEEWLPNTRTLVKNERVKYVNYFHGPFNDLIFGTGLVDYAFSHGDHNVPSTVTDKGQVLPSVRPPLIVTKCIDFIEQPRCVQTPGIYRLSAKYSRVQALTSVIEQDESSFQFDTEREDPILVASVLKLYLRELPEPVMPMKWEERIKYTHEREEHIRTGFANFKSRIRRMPPIHQATLRALLLHLSFVASHAAANKMTLSNLAVVFSPVILSETDHETTSIAAASEEDRTLEDLIKYCGEIFAVPAAYANPLPPVPSTPPKEPADASEPMPASMARSTSLYKSLGDHQDPELGGSEEPWGL
ncbi:unnamed protein product [Malassezia sympodialis ATCC 42132]|nr:uncharacterized protein MSY001_0860 [Malassezia sympodialis ATCC 42132]CCU98154.1 unnamed protein product [Malassezia sympodialis ATCC 42132]|eukprot:XP_018739475.1 uncharacterized protein MSY001_0860 [Malassezia sympodialis ATCC 42132]